MGTKDPGFTPSDAGVKRARLAAYWVEGVGFEGNADAHYKISLGAGWGHSRVSRPTHYVPDVI
jgi:hypothetical protein